MVVLQDATEKGDSVARSDSRKRMVSQGGKQSLVRNQFPVEMPQSHRW